MKALAALTLFVFALLPQIAAAGDNRCELLGDLLMIMPQIERELEDCEAELTDLTPLPRICTAALLSHRRGELMQYRARAWGMAEGVGTVRYFARFTAHCDVAREDLHELANTSIRVRILATRVSDRFLTHRRLLLRNTRTGGQG